MNSKILKQQPIIVSLTSFLAAMLFTNRAIQSILNTLNLFKQTNRNEDLP